MLVTETDPVPGCRLTPSLPLTLPVAGVRGAVQRPSSPMHGDVSKEAGSRLTDVAPRTTCPKMAVDHSSQRKRFVSLPRGRPPSMVVNPRDRPGFEHSLAYHEPSSPMSRRSKPHSPGRSPRALLLSTRERPSTARPHNPAEISLKREDRPFTSDGSHRATFGVNSTVPTVRAIDAHYRKAVTLTEQGRFVQARVLCTTMLATGLAGGAATLRLEALVARCDVGLQGRQPTSDALVGMYISSQHELSCAARGATTMLQGWQRNDAAHRWIQLSLAIRVRNTESKLEECRLETEKVQQALLWAREGELDHARKRISELEAELEEVRRENVQLRDGDIGILRKRVAELEVELAGATIQQMRERQTMRVMLFRQYTTSTLNEIFTRREYLKRMETEVEQARQVATKEMDTQASRICKRVVIKNLAIRRRSTKALRKAADEKCLLEQAVKVEQAKRANLQRSQTKMQHELEAEKKARKADRDILLEDKLQEKKRQFQEKVKKLEDEKILCMANTREPIKTFFEQGINAQLAQQAEAARGSGAKGFSRVIRQGVDSTGRFDATKLITGRSEEAALGMKDLLCIDQELLNEKSSGGVDAIVDEIHQHGTQVDKDCLDYVLNGAAGSWMTMFPNYPSPPFPNSSWPPDCNEHGVLSDRVIMQTGKPMVLSDFMACPSAQLAGLSAAQVLALRLYTTAAFISINGPLRDMKRQTSHKLAATVLHLRDGIKKLRAVEKTNRPLDLWRGMRNLEASSNFKHDGGSERAVMSTTSDPHVAIQYGISKNSLVFKVVANNFMHRGASLAWLSAFPTEAEYCYPPLTYLKPTGKSEVVEVTHVPTDGAPYLHAKVTIIEVEPTMG